MLAQLTNPNGNPTIEVEVVVVVVEFLGRSQNGKDEVDLREGQEVR